MDLFGERLFIFKGPITLHAIGLAKERRLCSDRFCFNFSRHAGTIKSFVNELTLIANGSASACITVGMPRNFAFIRENALTNNRIDVNKRFELDEKVSRGNKLTTGVYAMSSLSSKSE